MALTAFQASNQKLRFLLAVALIENRKKEKKRKLYIRELFRRRSIHGEYFLLPDLSNDEKYHKTYFRMDTRSFNHLLQVLSPSISHPLTHAYPIPAKLRLAVTLRYLATGCSQLQLAMSYRISPSSVGKILRETMTAIIKSLEQIYLPSPTYPVWKESEEIFHHKWNFPFCLGAIDGKHVRIKCPVNSGSTSFNYKGFFSQVLMAVVGGDYRFLVVDIGAPGSDCDAAIFNHMKFSKGVENKTLQIPENGVLGGKEFPHVFVADEAFPLKPWLMRPFPGKDLNIGRRIFNFRLSRARRIVENAFGIWAARWRIFFTPIDGDPDLVHLIIRSTLILHNFLRCAADQQITEDILLEDGTIQEGNWRNDINHCFGVQDIPRVGSNNYTMQAFAVRDQFMDYFCSAEGELEGQEEYVTRS